MIVNRNVIHDSILRKTVGQQVERLAHLCSNRRLSQLQQKIEALQKELYYSAYSHNQKLQAAQTIKNIAAKAYLQAINDKKQADAHLRQIAQENRVLLSNLQKCRKEVITQGKKKTDEGLKNQQLGDEEKKSQDNISQCALRVQEQKNWIKRLKVAQQLCRKEIIQQQESISKLKAEIKIESLAISSIKNDSEELRRSIDSVRQLKQHTFIKIESETKMVQLGKEDQDNEAETLKSQKDLKIVSISEYEYKSERQNDQICQIDRLRAKVEDQQHQVQAKIVNHMKLVQEVNNQIFATKLSQTNVKVKNKELINKIQRLRKLKADIIDLIQ